jgi:CsoR family transcriptional regulator, copper-sensing transcriptional repressor
VLDIYPQGVYAESMHHSHKKLVNRLHILQGQLQGLERMVEKDKTCADVIRLSLAVQKSLQSFNQEMVKSHLQQHVDAHVRNSHHKATRELLEIYLLNNK